MVAPLTLGFVTDLHFGPEARFEGKLRKLTHHAADLTARVVDAMNTSIRPDALVNLGDDVEDESPDLDLGRYRECQTLLQKSHAPVINVAGNHDIVHIKTAQLNEVWGRSGKLYYSLDIAGWHLVVLHTVERRDVDIRIDAEQLRWLRDDLASAAGPVIVLMHHSASDQDLDDSRWFAKAPHVALVKNRSEFRAIVEESGKVRAVFNGHLHRNHFDVIRGIPYVTFQSLIENLDDDAPGRAAATHAVARFDATKMVVRVLGEDPARYQFHYE